MTTLADTIARTKAHLYSGETRDERDQLNGAISSSATGLGLRYARSGAQEGATLAIDLEELYVWEGTNGNLVVNRGEGGSTAAAHVDESTVFINPKFSAWAILNAVNDELGALSAEGLFAVDTLDITYDPGTDAYNLAGVTDDTQVLSVDFDANDGTERWLTLDPSRWVVRRNQSTSNFASGLSLTINGYVESGMPMRVTYKTVFTPLATLADNVATVSGLHTQAHDILPYGAALRLVAGNEVSRNSLDQYETRRAEEIGTGSRAASMRPLAAMRDRRIADERARLYAKYPAVRR